MDSGIPDKPLKGAAFVILAMTGIGLIDNFIPLIAEDAGLWQFHAVRAGVVIATVLALAPVLGWRLRPRNRGAVALRSFFFSTSMVLYFGSAGVIPIAQAGAGLFTAPIFVLLISVVFLGERIGFWRVAAVLIGFLGVLLVLGPGTGEVSLLSLLPVIGGVFYALNGIATRRWCVQETTMTLLLGLFLALGIWGCAGLLWFGLFPSAQDAGPDFVFFTRGWVAPTAQFTLWTLVQAFGSLVAVGFLTRGYQLADVSRVVVFEYSFLISAAFWGYLLYHHLPDFQTGAGIMAIVLSGSIIALRARA